MGNWSNVLRRIQRRVVHASNTWGRVEYRPRQIHDTEMADAITGQCARAQHWTAAVLGSDKYNITYGAILGAKHMLA
eukprot:11227061-Lingulodinium_polyedra.AAC.1